MIYIERIIRAYAHMIRHTIDTLKKSPLILAVIPVASLLLLALQMILVGALRGSQLTYVILHLAEAAVISLVLSSYEETVTTKRLTLRKIHSQMFGYYLFSVYLIRVISVWIVQIVSNVPLPSLWILHMASFLILSPLPEVLYQEHSKNGHSLEVTWEYLTRNWYVWLPFILIFTAILSPRYPHINGSYLKQSMMITEIFQPFKGVSLYPLTAQNVIRQLIKNVILGIYVLARGHLYRYTRLGNAKKDANRYG